MGGMPSTINHQALEKERDAILIGWALLITIPTCRRSCGMLWPFQFTVRSWGVLLFGLWAIHCGISSKTRYKISASQTVYGSLEDLVGRSQMGPRILLGTVLHNNVTFSNPIYTTCRKACTTQSSCFCFRSGAFMLLIIGLPTDLFLVQSTV
jgi:hypothetical protein